jgi:hypothetical protein
VGPLTLAQLTGRLQARRSCRPGFAESRDRRRDRIPGLPRLGVVEARMWNRLFVGQDAVRASSEHPSPDRLCDRRSPILRNTVRMDNVHGG